MSQQPFNPFEHHHHHHDEEAFNPAELDPAQQSLNDALRVSFTLLKIVMLLVLVYYIFSGFFTVAEQERAVRLRFGKMVVVDETGGKLLAKGFHWAWPFPFEEVIKIPTTTQKVRLDKAFMFDTDQRSEGQTLDEMAGRPLNPEKDGSLLTGDANIVHARWQIEFRINEDRAEEYIENVGNIALANRLVRFAAEQGAVYAAANVTADEFIRNTSSQGAAAARRAQQVLEEMGSGLLIVSMSIDGEPTVPIGVRSSYRESTNAVSQRDQEIQKALQFRDETLGEAAGEAWGELWEMIQAYELARLEEDEEKIAAAQQRLNEAFARGYVGDESNPMYIGGEASRVVNSAKSYRTQVVERIRSEANEFQQLVRQYRENPDVFMDRKIIETWRAILSNDVEVMYLPENNQYRVLINRNPEVRQRREERRLEQRQQ